MPGSPQCAYRQERRGAALGPAGLGGCHGGHAVAVFCTVTSAREHHPLAWTHALPLTDLAHDITERSVDVASTDQIL